MLPIQYTRYLYRQIPARLVIAEDASELVLNALVNNSLAHEEGRVVYARGVPIILPKVAEWCTLAPLYGVMELTGYIVKNEEHTALCIPYGTVTDNKSVLGNGSATRERTEAALRFWYIEL
ncbi:hypothetical protein V8B97DRAFT_1917745 [Scleroderma yunnanense]